MRLRLPAKKGQRPDVKELEDQMDVALADLREVNHLAMQRALELAMAARDKERQHSADGGGNA